MPAGAGAGPTPRSPTSIESVDAGLRCAGALPPQRGRADPAEPVLHAGQAQWQPRESSRHSLGAHYIRGWREHKDRERRDVGHQLVEALTELVAAGASRGRQERT